MEESAAPSAKRTRALFSDKANPEPSTCKHSMRHGKSKNKYVPIPICDFGLGHALKNKWHACPGSYNKGGEEVGGGRCEEEVDGMR